MGLLAEYLDRTARLKQQQKQFDTSNTLRTLEHELYNNPDLTGPERHDIYEKMVKSAGGVTPAEDQIQHGGLFGAIGHLIHHHGKAMDAQAAQGDLAKAKQRVAETAPGMGAPAAGSPNPGATMLTPPGSNMQPPTPPPPQPPAEVNRGMQGAGNAISGDSPGSNPVNAAAGAGMAPPAAQASAATPIPVPPPPSQWMSLPARTQAMQRQGLDTASESSRANDLAKIAQRKKLMDENPEMFKDLQPFERIQFMTGGNITRGASVGKGPVIQKPDGTYAQQIIDPYSGSIIGERNMGGVPLTAAREKVAGAPFLDPADNQWKVNIVDFGGKFVRAQPIGGTPAGVVIAGAPTQTDSSHQGFQTITNPDGSTSLLPVTTSTSGTHQRQIPGAPAAAGPLAIPPLPGSAPAPARPKPSGPSPRVGTPIPTGGVKGPLTAKQRMDVETGVQATDRAMLPMQRMLNNLDILDNPAMAKAIQMQADPHTGDIRVYLSGKLIAGNPKAEQFATDVRAAMEDINVIRKMFGAQGFRGQQGFDAMISQAGGNKLLQNKNVFRNTLTKTLADMKAVRDTQAKYIAGPNAYTGHKSIAAPPPPGVPATAEDYLKSIGYQ